jgi:hypothetical protein
MTNMEMTNEILRRFIRLPWQEFEGEGAAKYREITSDVRYNCGANDAFRKAPVGADTENELLQSIAIPVIIAAMYSDNQQFQERVGWNRLPEKDRELVLRCLGIEREHDSMLVLVKETRGLMSVASYLAATYALTTYIKSYVVMFDELESLAFDLNKDDSALYNNVLSCGLLVIVGFGSGNRVGADRIYGFIRSLLDRRVAKHGGTHVIVDTAEEAVSNLLYNGAFVQRHCVEDMYRDIFPPHLRVFRILTGRGVYIYPTAKHEAERRECGKTAVV